MTKEEAKKSGLVLANKSAIALLGVNGNDGYPTIKAMLKMENEGLKTIWFSTNTSSKRVGLLKKDPRACVYFIDSEKYMGLMLLGEVEVLQDSESKKKLWRDGFEMYYPLGSDDPDYSVLRFTAHAGNYYHNLENVTFEI